MGDGSSLLRELQLFQGPPALLLPKLMGGGFITASPPTHQARSCISSSNCSYWLPGKSWEMWIISSKLICRYNSILQVSEQPNSLAGNQDMLCLKTSRLNFQTGIQTAWDWGGPDEADEGRRGRSNLGSGSAAGPLNLTSGQISAAL